MVFEFEIKNKESYIGKYAEITTIHENKAYYIKIEDIDENGYLKYKSCKLDDKNKDTIKFDKYASLHITYVTSVKIITQEEFYDWVSQVLGM